MESEIPTTTTKIKAFYFAKSKVFVTVPGSKIINRKFIVSVLQYL